jgi:hypothetical protein
MLINKKGVSIMSAKSLGNRVRFAVIGMFICGFAVCAWALPDFGISLAREYPEFAVAFTPWLMFIWITALPCVCVLYLGWNVAGAISRDEAFTPKTAKQIKTAATLIFISVGIFFVGNILFLFLNMSHPGIVLASFFVDVAGIAVAIITSTLSRYVTKAADLQEDVEGTI